MELGILECRLEVGRDGGYGVAVDEAVDAEFHTVGAAYPLGDVVSRVGLGLRVDFRFGDRRVVVCIRDGEAKRELSGGSILGKCARSIYRKV